MSALAADLQAGLAILRRDYKLALAYRTRLFTQLLGAFFTLTLFYYISRLVTVRAFSSPDAYYAFAVIGIIILQVVSSILLTPGAALRQELVAGTFERIVVSPFGVVGGLLSIMLFPFAYAAVTAVAMLGFAVLVFGLDVHWSSAPLVIPVGMLAAVSFAPFGVLLVAAGVVTKQATVGTTWIIAGISMISGLYFPVTLLPDSVQWLSEIQPFTPAVDLMRHLLIDTPLVAPVAVEIAKLVAFAAILLPIAIWVLSAAVELGRRRGTLIEY